MAAKQPQKLRDVRYKAPLPEIGKRRMTPQHCAAVQELFILINHYRMVMNQFETNLREMLIKEYGVDIGTGQWTINMQTGELVQKPAADAGKA